MTSKRTWRKRARKWRSRWGTLNGIANILKADIDALRENLNTASEREVTALKERVRDLEAKLVDERQRVADALGDWQKLAEWQQRVFQSFPSAIIEYGEARVIESHWRRLMDAISAVPEAKFPLSEGE